MAKAKPRTNGEARPDPARDRVLELTTGAGASPGYVRIDGRTYELADPAHFGLRAGGAIWRGVERIAALEAISEPSEADEREYRERLERIAQVALPELEAEVTARLATGQLADLVIAFFALVASANPRLRLLLGTAEPSAPAGTTSSPSSPASTAATR